MPIIVDINKHGIRREINTDKLKSKNAKRRANDQKMRDKWKKKDNNKKIYS